MKDLLFYRKIGAYELIIERIDRLCSMNENEPSIKDFSNREKEVIASKKLINYLYPKASISHNKFGAPTISNNKAISLSHSETHLACVVANHTAAVDIELIRPKAFNTKHRFLNNMEIKLIKTECEATLLWSAKECMYKIYQQGNVTFSKDLIIHDFKKNIITCSIFEKRYLLNFEKFKKHWLVYYFD